MDALLQYGSECEDSGSEKEPVEALRPHKRRKGCAWRCFANFYATVVT